MPLQYKPLTDPTREIRLLTLHPGSRKSPLRCSLNHGFLISDRPPLSGAYLPATQTSSSSTPNSSAARSWETALAAAQLAQDDSGRIVMPPGRRGVPLLPTYEALSYTWGDPDTTAFIEINGTSQHAVTRNLHSALLRLRKAGDARNIWVDALCIDQSNVSERSAEVLRMPQIYRLARRVVVWLGDEAGGSAVAMRCLKRLGGDHKNMARLMNDHSWLDPADGGGGEREREKEMQSLGMYSAGVQREDQRYKAFAQVHAGQDLIGPGNLSEGEWKAITIFLKERPYWTRIWIVQEIANAQAVKLYCGRATMRWETLKYFDCNSKVRQDREGLQRLLALFEESGIAALMRQQVLHRQVSRSNGTESSTTSFLNLLRDFRRYESTDPRDKVFALLGLPACENVKSLTFVPDYRASVEMVFTAVARDLIMQQLNLDVLRCAQPRDNSVLGTLPSWAPDWTQQLDSQPRGSVGPQHWGCQNYRASEGLDIERQEALLFEKSWRGSRRRATAEDKPLIWGGSVRKSSTSTDDTSQVKKGAEIPSIAGQISLNGVRIGILQNVGRTITASDWESGRSKTIVREWEELYTSRPWKTYPVGADGCGYCSPSRMRQSWTDMYEACASSLPTVVPLYPFLTHMWRGDHALNLLDRNVSFRNHRKRAEVLVDQYLIWSQQLSREDSKGVKEEPDMYWYQAALQFWVSAQRIEDFDAVMREELRGWKIASTESEKVMVPCSAEVGDVVTVLGGGDVPFLFRKKGEGFELLGSVYVEEYMFGQAAKDLEEGRLEMETFLLS